MGDYNNPDEYTQSQWDNSQSENIPQGNNPSYNGYPSMNGQVPVLTEAQANSLKGYDEEAGSKSYSILCIALAFTFLICVFLYIYLTRNKNYPDKIVNYQRRIGTGYSTSHSHSHSHSHSALQSTSSTNRLNVHIEQFPPLPISSTLKSTYNISNDSVDKGYNSSGHMDKNINTNMLNNVKMAAEKAHIEHLENQKNYRYPNPLFAHSKPIPRIKDEDQNPNVQSEIIRTNADDTVIDAFPESVNILTQEEIKLLKMRKKSLKYPQPEVPPFPRAFNKQNMVMDIPSNDDLKSKITITPFNYSEEQSSDDIVKDIVPQTDMVYNKRQRSNSNPYYKGDVEK